MTLDEAIKVLRQHNVTGASVLRITRGQALEKDLLAQVLDNCEQLISEKAEYKRLLKAAVEGLDNCADKCICDYCDSRCPFYYFGCVSGWKYRDEALALIGEEGDTNE